jgi:hypothetical protein
LLLLEVAKNIEVALNRDEVCRRLGYEKGQSLRPRASSLVDSQLGEARLLIKPHACYTIKSITGVSSSTLSIDGMVLRSRQIAPMFSGCSRVAVFLVTIGVGLEKRVAQLMGDGLAHEAFVLDTTGSVAVEEAADWLEGEIGRIAAAKGHRIGWRYSPGYCDWDIVQQKELFGILDGESIGVDLTGECLMVPRKSISGIIGMGESCITSSACRFCNRKDCPTRREVFVSRLIQE